MSKKNKKSKSLKLQKRIKSLEIELSKLKSKIEKLQPSSGLQSQNKKAKEPARKRTLKVPKPVPAKVEIAPADSNEEESVAARTVGGS